MNQYHRKYLLLSFLWGQCCLTKIKPTTTTITTTTTATTVTLSSVSLLKFRLFFLLILVSAFYLIANSSSLPYDTTTVIMQSSSTTLPEITEVDVETEVDTNVNNDEINYNTTSLTDQQNIIITQQTTSNVQQQSEVKMNNDDHVSKSVVVNSTAICSPTLFGTSINLTYTIQWARYHYALGFNHIYLWYKNEISTVPNFNTLQNLSYVTLVENTKFATVDEQYFGQESIANDCIQLASASKYEWILFSDTDEYLWFADHITVQEFIKQQQMKANGTMLSYMSFGKIMYTMKNRIESVPIIDNATSLTTTTTTKRLEDLFHVTLYPFTPGEYCYKQNCHSWMARAKIMMMPSVYPTYGGVHGWINLPANQYNTIHNNGIHFDVTRTAHLKEWAALNNYHIRMEYNNSIKPMVDYNETNNDKTMHWFLDSHTKIEVDGTTIVHMKYDGESLHSWFRYVASNIH